MSNKWLGRVTQTRAVQAAVSRMCGQTAGDVTAFLGSGRMGYLLADQALAVPEGGGDVVTLNNAGSGGAFDEGNPPVGYQWFIPDVEEPPPSLSGYQTGGDVLPVEHATQGTDGGNGTGKLITVWDASKFVMKCAGRLAARVEQSLDGVPGYKGFAARHAARKIVGRAASVALATVFSNTLSNERRKQPARFISTRRWKDNRYIGRHCGYYAYYRPRGRPALPRDVWIANRKAYEAKRRKGGTSRNRKGGYHAPETIRKRPTKREWAAVQRNPVIGQARIANHRRGRAWTEGWEDFLREVLSKPAEELAEDFGKEAAAYIKREALDPFFRWLRKGAEAQRPRTQNQELNTPDTRY